MKRIHWEFSDKEQKIFISQDSIQADLEKQFEFKLKRYKNNKFEEWLKIKCLYNGAENGKIETCLSDLDKDIRKFERFGVAFDGFAYASLALCIRSNYLKLLINEEHLNDTVLTEEAFNKILQMFCEVIGECYDFKEKSSTDTYDIPVEEFNSIVEDSEYNIYKLFDIRERLKEKKYIKCGQGRTSRQVRLDKGKNPVRVISFFKQKINHLISNIENKKDEVISLK